MAHSTAIDESAETFSEDVWCPYCDKLRRYDRDGMLLKTCGDAECHSMAISVGGRERNARRVASVATAIEQYPRPSKDIDFHNGFASQNLTFAKRRV